MKKDTVLVCGSRFAKVLDIPLVDTTMLSLYEESEFSRVVTGDAKGYDSLAKAWANVHGLKYQGYPADWKKYGKAAGPIRNRWMFENERHKLMAAVIFPGGSGTNDMASILYANQDEYQYFIIDLRDLENGKEETKLTIS